MRHSLSRPFRALAAPALLALPFALPFASLPAQASGIQPVQGDTIYRLAVDSAGYRQYAFVYLLDDGVVRIEADGRATERYHQIVQILKPAGVEPWAERRFSYRPGHTKLTVNWMRVVRPSGEVISDKPVIAQESTVPASMSDPVFSDSKVVRYSLSGVAVGTLVDISWTTETTDPFLKGDFLFSWATTMDYPALRSRYAVDVPASLTPRIVEEHLNFARREEKVGGRHYYFWEKRQSMPVKGELFAPDSSVPRTSITIGSPLRWNDVARWYAGLAKDRYSLSHAAAAKVDSIVRTERTEADTIQALHRWIASDIRYVSVALGLGGYQPRLPDSTIATGLGDCKDKATLFIAAAKHLGLTAYPVLLSSTGGVQRDLVSISQFDHVIAAMPKPGGAGYAFLDLTTDALPPGELPPSYQGEFGLVVLPGGKSEQVTFPEDAPPVSTSSFEGRVDSTGRVSGRLTYLAKGSAETQMRSAFLEPMDSTRRALMEKMLGRVFPSGTADSVTVFDGRDPHAQARITAQFHGGEAFKRVGTVAILTVPAEFRGPGGTLGYALSQLPATGERTLPIDASLVVGAGTTTTELRLTLPAGWKAQLPKNVAATSVFGDYHAEYSQDGRVLRIAHTISGAKGVFPKERMPELRAWLKAVADDNIDSIALTSTVEP
jgi:transglutaminase-like putative cysteine protease